MGFKTLEWKKGRLYLLDQTKLPLNETYVGCSTYQEVARAIKNMIVRGAPAIGVAAAFGVVLGIRQFKYGTRVALRKHLDGVTQALISTRPTAVNLVWAVERMRRLAFQKMGGGFQILREELEKEALRILEEDLKANREIGRQGQVLIPDGVSVLTYCNAGALATAGYGTALGVIRAAQGAGKRIHVYVGETRPLLQGARLTTWELKKDRIPCTLIADNMAGWLMAQGKIHLAITGADRIAANGDAANKIGTYSMALLCRAHRLPFYVAAPISTIDLSTARGEKIPIEERASSEVTTLRGKRMAPHAVKAYNPAFDVTPHRFISAIITERGIVQNPYRLNLKKVLSGAIPDEDQKLIG
jgi:methylthioribose-1-phosphate isomerase